MVVFGTRPEVIKLAPVIRHLDRAGADVLTISTGQHRQMLDQTTGQCGVAVDVDLDVMTARQTLSGLMARILDGFAPLVDRWRPDVVVVQGDTTTALAAGLAAFYVRVPVAHVEAGLRTGDAADPFPEEVNRRLIGRFARVHFAPTARAAAHLLAEGVSADQVVVTGNTVIDQLLWTLDLGIGVSPFRTELTRLLVTLHRRESHGPVMAGIAQAVRDVADTDRVEVVLPLHRSPAVRDVLVPLLGGHDRVTLTEPLDYPDFTRTLSDCDIVLTDSGGVQEEAPTLGKPVLVCRETTERPEGIEAGTSVLVGTERTAVRAALEKQVTRTRAGIRQPTANPFGDGHGAERITTELLRRFADNSLLLAAAGR